MRSILQPVVFKLRGAIKVGIVDDTDEACNMRFFRLLNFMPVASRVRPPRADPGSRFAPSYTAKENAT
jgi:hypothetical protein